MTRLVVVVGGGITGLTAAHRFRALPHAPEVVVLEAGMSPGGKVSSREVGGLRLEAGPDSLLARKPWAVELARDLGFTDDDLVAPSSAPTHIWTARAGLVQFPTGPFGIAVRPAEFLRWPGMSIGSKLRAAGDLVLPRRHEGTDESLGSLVRRRIGNGATNALVAPLLGGLFAGDVDRLSVLATFPELAAWEREHGSLMRGARAASARAAHVPAGAADVPAPAKPPMFLRLRGGLSELTDRLATAVGPSLQLGAGVRGLTRDGDRFVVDIDGGSLRADAVVLTTPAHVSAQLLRPLLPQAAGLLDRIPYVSTAVVLLVYPEGSDERVLASAGFVAPRGSLPMNAATIVSKKWPDPSFGSRAVLRCFVGGVGTQELSGRTDDEVVHAVTDSLTAVLGLPLRPDAAAVVRWPNAMPQYEVGHLALVDRIEHELPPGIFIAGAAYRGAGLPDCVRQANELAARLADRLVEAASAE